MRREEFQIRGEVLIAELSNSDAEHPGKVIGVVDAFDSRLQ